ncbi:hypothetical protein [Helicobacter zhangjianzhongii]|uniref:hypothetical protein n=1 Tax=Helicobacter zhangjianzhongii TaxID=2974574 RepID=UPI002553C0BF|nr:hypothetical protein [Helicobacter sp. CPD2-1]MDL0080827.1 hypothetical protein [Helicobacter sp. CPD2-1]
MGFFTSMMSPLFSKVFIAINIDAITCTIKVIRIKHDKQVESLAKEFKTTENQIPMEAVKLIRRYKHNYPFTYVSAMIKTLSQGVVLQKDSKDFFSGNLKASECQISSSETIRVFAKRSMIKDYLRRFNVISGVDFVFSPFLIIDQNAHDLPTLGNNVYVLLQRSNIALMVVYRGVATFSGFFIAEGEVPMLNKEEQRSDIELKNFDELSLDDDFDEFAKIALDPSIEHLQTDMFIPNLDETKIVYDDMPKAKIISKILVDAIKEYYQNPLYKGEFIDKVILLDACKISDQAYEFIAKELMLETVKRDVNLPDVLIQFAQRELKGK